MSAAIIETRAQPLPDEQARPALWQNRSFLSIWAGHTLSILGDGFNSVALGLWVLQSTGSASAMAVIMTVKALVSILLGPSSSPQKSATTNRRPGAMPPAPFFITWPA